MDVLEIVTRKSPQVVSQQEMEHVVEEYIKEKKNAGVKIDITKGIKGGGLLTQGLLARQLNMLNEAFDVASKYFIQKSRA